MFAGLFFFLPPATFIEDNGKLSTWQSNIQELYSFSQI